MANDKQTDKNWNNERQPSSQKNEGASKNSSERAENARTSGESSKDKGRRS